jgi:hypothetical protein
MDFGLVVVWPRGRSDDAFVLDAVGGRGRILEVTEVTWTPELTAAGYARFSLMRLDGPHDQAALDRRGVGAALVIACAGVGGDEPNRPRGAGEEVRLLAALEGRLGKGSVHVARNPFEAGREYMLLLERSADGALARGAWNGETQQLERDLAGTGGWSDPRQMFAVLNVGAPYVVLRNFDGLVDLQLMPGHADIDILTSDYQQTVAMLGAQSRLRALPRWGGRFDVRIGLKSVICDLRFPGDDYYAPDWARQILAGRRLHPDGFYVPNDEELLDTMLYHAVVHKPEVSADYATRLAAMAPARGRTGWTEARLADRSAAHALLLERLAERGYSIRKPKDPTVFFNNRLRRASAPLVWRLADALRRRLYRLAVRNVLYPARFAARSIGDAWRRNVTRLRTRVTHTLAHKRT